MTCLLLVDGHLAFMDGVRAWLGADFTVVTARNREEMLDMLDHHSVDLVLCEMQFGGDGHGLHLMQVLHERACRFMVCSSYPGIALLRAALQLGACAFFDKRDALQKLRMAIDMVISGGTYFDVQLQKKILQAPDAKFPRGLTRRERSLIPLLYDRRLKTQALLATALHIATGTCANILFQMYEKFHVNSREQLLKKLRELEYYPEVNLQNIDYLLMEYMS